MKESLLIVGAGEYGQLVKELAELLGYQKIDFLDDNSKVAVGKIVEYQKYVGLYNDFIVAIGNSNIRKQIVESMQNYFNLCKLIHPTAVVSKSALIERGCVVEANVVVNTEVRIDTSCLINAGSVINHNSVVKAYCQIDCNAVVAADAVVPEGTKIVSCSVWEDK